MDMIRKSSRKAAMDKAKKLAGGDPHEKVDASSWYPPEAMESEVKTGMRPVSKRAFKRGGKVAHAEGHVAHKHAGKKPRKSGGSAMPTVDRFMNKDFKKANDFRDGSENQHVGAMKRGGRAHKDAGGMLGDPRAAMMQQMQSSNRAGVPSGLLPSKGGTTSRLAKSSGLKHGGAAHSDIAEDRKLIKQMIKPDALKHKSREHHKKGGAVGKFFAHLGKMHGPDAHPDDCKCHMCHGGAADAKGARIARATGGKAGKGKTNIHINIAPHGGAGAGAMPPPAMPPRAVPVPPPQAGAGAPPMGAGMPMPIPVPMGGGAPPQGMPMGRKHGGRTHRGHKHSLGR